MATPSSPDSDQQQNGSQALEDLACAYWLSDVLFAALELQLFTHLGPGPTLVALTRSANCLGAPLARLLTALAQLGLVHEENGRWHNQPLAARHLVAGSADYMGDFLLYRRYLQEPWQGLAAAVAGRPLAPTLSRQDDYPTRNLHYVRALDQLARQKATEIVTLLADLPWRGPLLDIGGGAGTLGRALIRQQPTEATLFELPEVLAAARSLYPDPGDWHGITTLAGDFRNHAFADDEGFGLILLANVLHTYDEAEARHCLDKAATLLAAGGHLLIHDYCPDRTPVKGQLYDLNMMLNTARGTCHQAHSLGYWLTASGLHNVRIIDLASDSSLILAQAPPC